VLDEDEEHPLALKAGSEVRACICLYVCICVYILRLCTYFELILSSSQPTPRPPLPHPCR
jgi:hypothetical protein